ncbi:MAG: isoprenyl transferase [Candidatus Izemoplasmatales bacterium]|jgi:undecaprenyl diphosphate synthase|nr:isoprenyl transferase [Candidatus Izemoplasmatales bacterium]
MILKNIDKSITIPKHIAIILDGNGRWAKKRHLPRTLGHKKGVENIKTIALVASEMGVKVLSVFAFSTENWKRPKDEVDYLMTLPHEFENQFKDDFEKMDIKVVFTGRKTMLSQENLDVMEHFQKNTKNRQGMILNICFDYGSYDELTEATKAIARDVIENKLTIEEITPEIIGSHLYTKDLLPLDLLIRPSGELRISNFMLWQLAYSELYFCDTFWPAFSKKNLEKAILDYNHRERRFGGLKG